MLLGHLVFYLKPVQSAKNGCDEVEFGRSIDEPVGVVLNFLKRIKKVLWRARKDSMTLI